MSTSGSDSSNVVIIGTFDGVHRGHVAMLQEARDIADEHEIGLAVATFHPHPRSVVAGGAPGMLCSLDERVELLTAAGADLVEVIPFTPALSALSPRDFVEEWLVKRLSAHTVCVGENFRFGHKAAGDLTTLRLLGSEFGFSDHGCSLRTFHDDAISSSRVRTALAGGDVERANEMLGRKWSVTGEVRHGAKRGRELGMRTANVDIPVDRIVPADGVYGGTVELHGHTWVAAISIGTNPQFTADDPDAPRLIEAHLPDYSGPEFYDAMITISVHERIRGQRTFDSIEDLVVCMNDDVSRVTASISV